MMTVAGEQHQQHTKKPVVRHVAIVTGLAAVLFVIIFVPTYLIIQRQQSHGKHALLVEKDSCSAAGFQLPSKEPKAPMHPATKKQPSIIYILVDDQGFDDLGLDHPAGSEHNFINTPNMDRLILQGMEFTNFYTTPMCSTSRAELLTGRYYPRTGAMYINTGWDFINRNETIVAEIMAAAGYNTAVFGKWHNGRTAGYQPYDVGFQASYLPTPYVHINNTMYINGEPTQTTGWMEEVLMDYALDYLARRQQDGQPFFMYYPTFSVHAGWKTTSLAGKGYQRPAPSKYLDKYQALPISADTASLYAMLEHFDDQVGRLLDFLDSSGLADNTFVMLSGDNGPALFQHEAKPLPKVVRMPSGMQGAKHTVLEGGIRNFLAVRGPGVTQGSSSNALLGLIDVLPTMVDLANLTEVADHLPWDGISFANLLFGQAPTEQQQERMLFSLQTDCIEDDFVPAVGPDRRTAKPQPLLSYTEGGVSGLGFKRCMAVRYKQYKWLADARTTQGRGPAYKMGEQMVPSALYSFQGLLHVELPCQEVSRQEPAVATKLEQAAESWFTDMVNDSHSFEKPLFYLGLKSRPGANAVADGAIERTPGRVQVLPMGLAGFVRPGDSASYRIKVEKAGLYEVSLFYQSSLNATFKLWIGPYRQIKARKAMHLDVRLPAVPSQRSSKLLGAVMLPQSKPDELWEVKLAMTGNTGQLQPAINALDTILFKRVGASGPVVPYNPAGQEGVEAWKAAHGYNKVQGGK